MDMQGLWNAIYAAEYARLSLKLAEWTTRGSQLGVDGPPPPADKLHELAGAQADKACMNARSSTTTFRIHTSEKLLSGE